MRTASREEWLIVRTIGELQIVVEAAFDVQAALYNMVVRVNDVIWSVAQSEDPIAEARAQILAVVAEVME